VESNGGVETEELDSGNFTNSNKDFGSNNISNEDKKNSLNLLSNSGGNISLRSNSQHSGNFDIEKSHPNLDTLNQNANFSSKPHSIIPSSFPGTFSKITRVGESSHDEVYQCLSNIDLQTYVIKIFYFGTDSAARRAVEEVRTFSALSKYNCANIVRYYGSWVGYRGKGSNLNNNSNSGGSSNKKSKQQRRKKALQAKNEASSLEEIHTTSSRGLNPKQGCGVGGDFGEFIDADNLTKKENISALHLCIQMECCEMTLTGWLHDRNTMSNAVVNMDVAKDFGLQILKGLEFIHSMNIVHKDFRPSNIFIKKDGNGRDIIKIGDFGLSTQLRSDKTAMFNEFNFGHYYYTPHETEITFKYDIFSAGIVFYELIQIFKTFAERHFVLKSIKDSCSLPIGSGPSMPDFLLIIRMISRNPEHRPTANSLLGMWEEQKVDQALMETMNLKARILYLEKLLIDNNIDFV